MSLRWSRRAGWLVLGVAAICALSLGALVGTAALDKETAASAKAFLFLVGAAAVVAALVLSEGAAWNARHWTAWLQPRPLAALFLAIFVAFGVMTDALSLFEPRPAVESEPGAIESGVNQIGRDVRRFVAAAGPQPSPTPRILQRLPGSWGEPGCAVTYRFTVRDRALMIESDRRPAGTRPFRSEATVTSSSGDVLHSVGEKPAEDRGRAATFRYSTNGATERLEWDAHSGAPLVLDRCA